MRFSTFLGTMACVVLISGCASRTSFVLTGENNWEPESGFAVGEIKIDLLDPAENSVFPGAEELAAVYRQAINEQLAEKEMLSSAERGNELDCDISYERVYSYGQNSGSLNHQRVSHVCHIKRGGDVVAVSERGPYKAYHGYFPQGARDIRSVIMRAGPDVEKKDVYVMVEAMVRDIERIRP